LDLSSQQSIKDCVGEIESQIDRLDVLMNNAGIMQTPYQQTEDGYELQIGVNHFGHFSLTGLLLPLLKKSPASRIITQSSIAHK